MVAKKDYKVIKKRSGRYAVVKGKGTYVNGEEKVKILVQEGLVKKAAKAKAAEETSGEA